MPPNFKVFHQKRRSNEKPLPPPPGLGPTVITFDAKPRTLQRTADLVIAQPILSDVSQARAFWVSWLTHPSLTEFKLVITPTYTSLGLHPSFMSFFEGYWYTLKEAVAGTLTISPALKSIVIEFTPHGHYVCADAPSGDGRIEKRNYGLLDLARPTDLGTMIACDVFESSGLYWPSIETLTLPSQIVQSARHAYPEHVCQDFALGAACGVSLRRMFPFAVIAVDGINVPDISTVDALLKVMPVCGVFDTF